MKTIYQPKYQKLIQELITIRKIECCLTQADLAKQLGKSQSYVAKIEGCERKLDVLEFVGLCRALDVPASEMIKVIE